MKRENMKKLYARDKNLLWSSDQEIDKKAVEEAVNSRASLAGANLAGMDLAGINLTGAELSDVNLSRANLSRANLSRANLSRANLAWTNLIGANLTEVNMAWTKLLGANLERANLATCRLIDGGLRSDGYRFFYTDFPGEGPYIKAGCRTFASFQEARDHWSQKRGGTPLGEETMLILDHLERLIHLRWGTK